MLRRIVPLTGFFFLTVSQVPGVVLSGGTGNTTAPADDPGFANVGVINGASAVYLGNLWVITAAHVGASQGGSVLFNNVTYTIASPVVRLTNNGESEMSQDTDLVLFQINVDPGLPPLEISANPATTGQAVTMIGNGRDRQQQLYWNVTPVAGVNNDVWVASDPASGYNVTGFQIATSGSGTTRWGTNTVAGGELNINTGSGDVFSFATIFDSGNPNDAQAVTGDSGGAVFRKTADGWELAGIMHAAGTASALDNFPPNAVFLNHSATFAADLSFYRDQILSITSPVPEPASALLAGGGLLLLGGRRRRTR